MSEASTKNPLPPLGIDLTGLFLAPLSRTPRGIDRVELAYARRFLQHWPGECFGVLPPPWGVRIFERERAIRFLEAVEFLWREEIDPSRDDLFAQTKSELLNGGRSAAAFGMPRGLSFTEILRRYLFVIRATGFSFGQPIAKKLPRNSLYLNVGQVQIFAPWLRWLKRRQDVTGVFMIHDVTPIEHPEFHRPTIVSLHHRIVRNTAGVAGALLFPSKAAEETVVAELRKHSPRSFLSHVELLPVPDPFLGQIQPDPELDRADYFIVCGAIDPHKNHLFLLDVWKRLIARFGNSTPRLLVAGSPQVSSKPFFDALDSDARLREFVVVSSGLSTPSLRKLIMGSRALLMPSISEGFGLPIVEALAQGTPVLASDIPAHREAGLGGRVKFLSLDRQDEWVDCIERSGRQTADERRAAARSYAPKTWAQYFEGVENFLLKAAGEGLTANASSGRR